MNLHDVRQIVFIDTPRDYKPKTALGDFMVGHLRTLHDRSFHGACDEARVGDDMIIEASQGCQGSCDFGGE